MGYRKTPTRWTWANMRQRCDNPKTEHYKYYGERGITYDPRWKHFKNFLADMGPKPDGMTLDRFPDVNGNYCKENCRWATWDQQSKNKQKPPSSPVVGVYWKKDSRRTLGGYWKVYTKKVQGSREILYNGTDFFEAVCRRKSYEAQKEK